jgi:predicted RNA-binding Zn ribbon-like protein
VVITGAAEAARRGTHMTEDKAQVSAFGWIGGSLCLDFANTVGSRSSPSPNERLHRYADLVVWSRQADLVTERQAHQLLREAERHPVQAARVLERATALREASHRIFSAIAAGRPPNEEDLNLLNAALAQALGHLRIVSTSHGFQWAWAGGETQLERLLWPVAHSVAELITSEELSLVRECANANCGWLFIDRSRNHSRRWCDMSDCGNRAKARRHYQRTRTRRGT